MNSEKASGKAVTQPVEDYLKAIFELSEAREAEEASTGELAEALSVSPPAVSQMLKQMVKLELVAHTPYRGVRLTPKGRRVALKTIRRHRLLERFLNETLGYPLESLHEEAERLEHYISEEFETRIDALLGNPDRCPHGSPIPTSDGEIVLSHGQPLAEVAPPAALRVERLRSSDPDLHRYLNEHGILPGMTLRLKKREPFGGDLTIEINGRSMRISAQAARGIIVVIDS